MLEFHNDTHTYYLNDKRIPGVSEIIKDLGISSLYGIDTDFIAYKKEVGTQVHKACDLIDLGIVDDENLPDDVIPYVAAYRDFIKDKSPIIESIEAKIHLDDMYAGTRDRMVILDGKTWTIDIKTGYPYRWHRLQTAAYWLAEKTDKRGSLYLGSDGSYELKEHDDSNDVEIWKRCVDLFHWKKPRYRNGKKNF